VTEPLGELRFNRLLVAIDGSATSDLALRGAVTAARRDNAALTLLVVAPEAAAGTQTWAAGAPDARSLQQDIDAESQKLIRETVERIPEDIPVTTRIRHGKPGPEIVAEATEHDYDAILLGARGLGRMRAMAGSVSGYVLHNAPTAVFVAHSPPEGREGAD
jgi:nucleotide-binding universal stress UspA family protein